MTAAQSLGNEDVDFLSDEGVRGVAEHLRDGLIREANAPLVVDDDECIR